VIRNNEPTHWFTIEFHEKAVGQEEATTGMDETTKKTIQKTTQKTIQKTTQKQREILVYLKDHPGAGRKEISLNVTGITESGIRANLQALRQKGLLKRIGPDKGGYWEVVGTGK